MTDSVVDLNVPFSVVVGTGVTTLLLASALAFVLFKRPGSKDDGAVSASSSVSTTNEVVVDREKYPGGSLYLYYATQTGTAESFARQMEREAAKHGFFCHVVDLEDVTDVTHLKTPCAILSATYGEGEPTDNSTEFVNLLKEAAQIPVLFDKMSKEAEEEKDGSELVQPLLKDIEYCVFGLGNRQYDHFNAMGKFFHEALSRLSAKAILPIGLGDDDNDLEGDFETWKDNEFWPKLKKLYVQDADALMKKNAEAKSSESSIPKSPFVVEYHDKPLKTNWKLPLEQVHGASRHYYDAVDCKIQVVRELRSKDDPGSTVHVELSCSTSSNKLKYTTADNLGVLPVNQQKHVDSVAKQLGYDLDSSFTVKAAPNQEWPGAPFPMPSTIREVLTNYCDLTVAPRRSELKLLARYATKKVDQQFLQRLSAKEAKTEYKEKIVDNYMGLVHLLEKCPSIQIPLENFVDICPRLQPRFFTIASSNQVHPKSIHLTVAVSQATRPVDKSLFEGVCSTYLATRQPSSSSIRAFVRPSSFRLPSDASKPILLIGPGTGVAPMRALLQERQHQKQNKKMPVGKNILYFGCKKRTLDYLYREEFEQWEKNGTLDAMHVAFSREQSEKVYVQHLLLKEAKDTYDLIHSEGAYIFVCGGVRMGNDVQEALKTIVQQNNVEIKSETQAKEYLDKLAKEGRYVQELWA